MKALFTHESGVITSRTITTALAVIIVGFTAWVLLRPDPAPTNQTTESGTSANSNNEERLASVVNTFCKTTFRTDTEKKLALSITADSMESTVFDTVISDGYARVAASCDSETIPEDLKQPGFTAYIELKKNVWTLYSHQTATPACTVFDNKKWPREIVGRCLDNGVERTVV